MIVVDTSIISYLLLPATYTESVMPFRKLILVGLRQHFGKVNLEMS